MKYRLVFWQNVPSIHQAPRVTMETHTRSGGRETQGVCHSAPGIPAYGKGVHEH